MKPTSHPDINADLFGVALAIIAATLAAAVVLVVAVAVWVRW